MPVSINSLDIIKSTEYDLYGLVLDNYFQNQVFKI